MIATTWRNGDYILSSEDGVIWEMQHFSNKQFSSIVTGGQFYILLGIGAYGAQQPAPRGVMVSKDGLNWYNMSLNNVEAISKDEDIISAGDIYWEIGTFNDDEDIFVLFGSTMNYVSGQWYKKYILKSNSVRGGSLTWDRAYESYDDWVQYYNYYYQKIFYHDGMYYANDTSSARCFFTSTGGVLYKAVPWLDIGQDEPIMSLAVGFCGDLMFCYEKYGGIWASRDNRKTWYDTGLGKTSYHFTDILKDDDVIILSRVRDNAAGLELQAESGYPDSSGVVLVSYDDGANWKDYELIPYTKTYNEINPEVNQFSSVIHSLAYDGKTYVAVGGKYQETGHGFDSYAVIFTSKDAKNWEPATPCDETGEKLKKGMLYDVIYANGIFATVGLDDNGGFIFISEDGLNWELKGNADLGGFEPENYWKYNYGQFTAAIGFDETSQRFIIGSYSDAVYATDNFASYDEIKIYDFPVQINSISGNIIAGQVFGSVTGNSFVSHNLPSGMEKGEHPFYALTKTSDGKIYGACEFGFFSWYDDMWHDESKYLPEKLNYSHLRGIRAVNDGENTTFYLGSIENSFRICRTADYASETADNLRRFEADKQWLTFSAIKGRNSNESNIIDHLALASAAPKGSLIMWESSNTLYIDTDGAVARPVSGEGDASVTLTAIISRNGLTDTLSFNVTVKEIDEDPEVSPLALMIPVGGTGEFTI